ncbi:MAG: hypothetical protein EPO68_07465 [Planctomycetota bacterium]|nr:MAG: hypothetical protein EPO68_07465 [Planctomycetota bacterium]
MSAIDIYRLQPGQGLELRVSSASASAGWKLEVHRPLEGASPDLALRLVDLAGREIGRGRVALADGYLAVAREMRGWLHRAGVPSDDFDLVPQRGDGEALVQSSSAN